MASSSAESVGDSAAYLRAHISYDASNVRCGAGFRACAMLRGIRGHEGVCWATEFLLNPPLDAVLQDTRAAGHAAVLQELAVGLLRAHESEEQKRILEGVPAERARMFSQHHEVRHAGQSGKSWLEAAESGTAARALAGGLGLAQTLLPQLWQGSQAGAAAQPMRPEDMLQLTSIFKGRWPFVGEKPSSPGEGKLGGMHTTMDVGWLMYYAGVAGGVVEPQPLTQAAFPKVLKQQGRKVRHFARRVGLGFTHYSVLETGLVEKARAHAPPPPWAASASRKPMWPGLWCILCEYLQMIEELGFDAVCQAMTVGGRRRRGRRGGRRRGR